MRFYGTLFLGLSYLLLGCSVQPTAGVKTQLRWKLQQDQVLLERCSSLESAGPCEKHWVAFDQLTAELYHFWRIPGGPAPGVNWNSRTTANRAAVIQRASELQLNFERLERWFNEFAPQRASEIKPWALTEGETYQELDSLCQHNNSLLKEVLPKFLEEYQHFWWHHAEPTGRLLAGHFRAAAQDLQLPLEPVSEVHWLAIMGATNYPHLRHKSGKVKAVSADQAEIFFRKLSHRYRFPTLSEWLEARQHGRVKCQDRVWVRLADGMGLSPRCGSDSAARRPSWMTVSGVYLLPWASEINQP